MRDEGWGAIIIALIDKLGGSVELTPEELEAAETRRAYAEVKADGRVIVTAPGVTYH